MFDDEDKWRNFSIRAQQKRDASRVAVRFSRPLLITGALMLAVFSYLDLLKF
jgi:hypothetical protein